MILRIILAFLIKLLLDVPLMLLGYIVVPLALLFEKDNHMPEWADLVWGNRDHGNDGEGFWARRTIGWPRFWRCYWWLVIRNPTFNWSKYTIGYLSKGTDRVIAGSDNPPVGDKKNAGWYYTKEGYIWEVYYIKPYMLLGRSLCIRFRCGWKIRGNPPGEVSQFCFVIMPFKKYLGNK